MYGSGRYVGEGAEAAAVVPVSLEVGHTHVRDLLLDPLKQLRLGVGLLACGSGLDVEVVHNGPDEAKEQLEVPVVDVFGPDVDDELLVGRLAVDKLEGDVDVLDRVDLHLRVALPLLVVDRPGTRSANGKQTVSTRSENGQHTVSTQSAHGQHAGSTRSARGQHTVSTRSARVVGQPAAISATVQHRAIPCRIMAGQSRSCGPRCMHRGGGVHVGRFVLVQRAKPGRCRGDTGMCDSVTLASW